MAQENDRKQKIALNILAYPVVLILISTAVNLFGFGITPAVIALPSTQVVFALVVAAVLLLLNHTWLMTSTELTRLNYNMRATPEEWDDSGVKREQVSQEGWRELERRHNAHRNATENTVYFILLALVMSLISPAIIAAQAWMIGFAVARLGYTYCYLKGLSGSRGIFMSLTLLGVYGLASYLAISLML